MESDKNLQNYPKQSINRLLVMKGMVAFRFTLSFSQLFYIIEVKDASSPTRLVCHITIFLTFYIYIIHYSANKSQLFSENIQWISFYNAFLSNSSQNYAIFFYTDKPFIRRTQDYSIGSFSLCKTLISFLQFNYKSSCYLKSSVFNKFLRKCLVLTIFQPFVFRWLISY